MDDRPTWERELEFAEGDLEPQDEDVLTLEELVEAIKELVFHAVELEPGSYAYEHFLEHGHKLRFGCCSSRQPGRLAA